jgi:hypothetical protein
MDGVEPYCWLNFWEEDKELPGLVTGIECFKVGESSASMLELDLDGVISERGKWG